MGSCPDIWVKDARSETVLSFLCGYQVGGGVGVGGTHGLISGPEGKQVELKSCGHWVAIEFYPFLLRISPRKVPWDGPPSTSQVTGIIRHSSQHLPCINSDNTPAYFIHRAIEEERGYVITAYKAEPGFKASKPSSTAFSAQCTALKADYRSEGATIF